MKITVTRELTDEFVSDVLIVAFDGSLGACWYWSKPAPTQWLAVVDDKWKQVLITEPESNEPNKVLLVDESVVQRGIQLLIEHKVGINNDLFVHLMTAVLEGDAGEVDADVADCIIQAGLFGQIVYG